MNFEQIQKTYNSKNLYEDNEFISNSKHKTWARPYQMCRAGKTPKFISDQANRFDIKQGYLGDCWFLAAMQVVCQNKELTNKILCVDRNSFDADKYCGAFVFQFFYYGKWVDVIIDDRIPCQFTYGKYRPVNLKVGETDNEDEVEFWPCLLEKAYAKLKGGYEKIIGGLGNEAFSDLVGASGSVINIENDMDSNEDAYFDKLSGYYRSGALITASTRTAQCGIVAYHAYSITGMSTVMNGRVKLICCKNPWGRTECEGLPWNDKSDIWRQYPEDKKRLQARLTEDGEFWMRFQDFCAIFNRITLSFVNYEMLPENLKYSTKKCWKSVIEDPNMVLPRGTYYGARHKLPKLRFAIRQNNTQIIASFFIKDRRKYGIKNIHTGISIYRMGDSDLRDPVFRMNMYEGFNAHENSKRVTLNAGEYYLVPSSLEVLDRDYPCFARVWEFTENENYGRKSGGSGGSKKEEKSPKGERHNCITKEEMDDMINQFSLAENKINELREKFIKYCEN